MPQIKCVCISAQRKTSAQNIHQCHADLRGLTGDIHQGKGERQVSLLPLDPIQDYFAQQKTSIEYGRFGENLVIEGMDWADLAPGDILSAGTVKLEIIKIGAGGPKSDAYHGKKVCSPMESFFVFCKIAQEGILQEGMEIVKEDRT